MNHSAHRIDLAEEELSHLQLISFPISKNIEQQETIFQPDADVSPKNFQDVTNMIEAVCHLEDQIEMYDTQSVEAVSFFKSKSNTAQLRIDQLKSYIKSFLDQKVLKNIQTVRGTAYIRKMNVKSWGDTDALLAWTQANAPQAVRVKYEPDKKLLSEHMKKTGECPDQYSEQPEDRLYIKR
ncbi:MAG: hypothetical protein ACOYNS_17570 [Bacteroidota bacterium]